jgi:hypothetical protein
VIRASPSKGRRIRKVRSIAAAGGVDSSRAREFGLASNIPGGRCRGINQPSGLTSHDEGYGHAHGEAQRSRRRGGDGENLGVLALVVALPAWANRSSPSADGPRLS